LYVELADGKKFQGRIFGTGPVIKLTRGILHNGSIIFDIIEDIEAYKNALLDYKVNN
jgi:hypothetical protein